MTIDEKELLRLGMLLESMSRGAQIQMVTITSIRLPHPGGAISTGRRVPLLRHGSATVRSQQRDDMFGLARVSTKRELIRVGEA